MPTVETTISVCIPEGVDWGENDYTVNKRSKL